jgi:MFS family permease
LECTFKPIGHIVPSKCVDPLSATEKNLPFLVFLAFFATLMPLTGRLLKKYSVKCVLAISPRSTTSFFGQKNQPSNYGIVFLAYSIGTITGNLMSGSAVDIFGGFRVVYYPTLILAVAGIFVAYFVIEPQKTVSIAAGAKGVALPVNSISLEPKA